MKQILFTSLSFILLMVLLLEYALAQRPAEDVELNKTVELFNGKNLEGWYTFLKDFGRDNDPKNVFTVRNGLLKISGEDWGGITTNEIYENYKLVVEFRWGELTFDPRKHQARDSGILLHATGEDGGTSGIWMNSLEVQLIEGGTGDFIVVGDDSEEFSITSAVAPEKQGNSPVFKPGGQPTTVNGGRINWLERDPDWKDVKGFRGENDVERPVGEWNRVEIIAVDDNILVYLNGSLVNEAYDVKPSKGKIQIQSEGAELYLRRISLTPLLED